MTTMLMGGSERYPYEWPFGALELVLALVASWDAGSPEDGKGNEIMKT